MTKTVDHSASIQSCARCEGVHENLPHFRFKQPFAPAELGFTWEFWATCPTTGDPILVSTNYVPPEGEETP
jgi:hypothetical protein